MKKLFCVFMLFFVPFLMFAQSDYLAEKKVSETYLNSLNKKIECVIVFETKALMPPLKARDSILPMFVESKDKEKDLETIFSLDTSLCFLIDKMIEKIDVALKDFSSEEYNVASQYWGQKCVSSMEEIEDMFVSRKKEWEQIKIELIKEMSEITYLQIK